MEGPSLQAPWRIEYIRSLHKESEGCFLCRAAALADEAEQRDALILWATPLTIVLMNRYPYTNGHLLIAPRAHLAEPGDLSDEQLMDVQRQSVSAIELLKRAMSPQGFNIGMNIGRCAGAGVPGHLHQHLVPRWGGDTNFMSIIGEVRIVPQATSQLFAELMRVRAQMSESAR